MMIRGLIQSDIPSCAEILCRVYNNELWQCRWDNQVAQIYLTDFYQHKKFVGYVIEEEGRIIGALFAHEKVWWNNSEVFIEEMFINPEYQRKGLGTELLSEVEKYVRMNNLAGITLSTNKYAPAHTFYVKNEFVDCEHVVFMCKVLNY
jgi:aminoglycoside 6'-N-acetyltransferase I